MTEHFNKQAAVYRNSDGRSSLNNTKNKKSLNNIKLAECIIEIYISEFLLINLDNPTILEAQ